MDIVDEHAGFGEFDELLRVAVRCALDAKDFVSALNSYRELFPATAPDLYAKLPPIADAQRAIEFAMFLDVWNRVPRPDNDWQPRPLPKTERNAPCPCGSTKKYKQCCGPLAGSAPLGGEALSLLSYVLERIHMSQFKDLPFKKLSPEEIGHVAEQWLDQDRHEEAVALLEPLLADARGLDERHEYPFDTLCDAYLDLGDEHARRQLVERLMQAPDRDLKTAAMHRRCTMYADEWDYPAAWKLFKEAQKIAPDDPSLAQLEVVLLISQEELEQAQERARFWAKRLKKLGYAGKPVVDMMEEIAHDPSSFVGLFHGNESDEDDQVAQSDVDRLLELIEALPAPTCHYRLQPQDSAAGPLQPDAALKPVEKTWGEVFTLGNASDESACNPWDNTGWLDWLAQQPLAWQSFAVLEDVMLAIDEADCLDEETQTERIEVLEKALLEHAAALLRACLGKNGAEACRLEWGWLENRPALRLLGRLIELLESYEEQLPLLEWLVLTLNPNDNQGLRENLIHVYAACGRAAKALEVCERYPDDALGATLYGRVLALHLLQRNDAAVNALKQARKESPLIFKTLTAKRPRMPDLTPGLMSMGGEDEAWYYRQDWRNVWQQTGALDWLVKLAH